MNMNKFSSYRFSSSSPPSVFLVEWPKLFFNLLFICLVRFYKCMLLRILSITSKCETIFRITQDLILAYNYCLRNDNSFWFFFFSFLSNFFQNNVNTTEMTQLFFSIISSSYLHLKKLRKSFYTFDVFHGKIQI
jgi:hypothetical protein